MNNILLGLVIALALFFAAKKVSSILDIEINTKQTYEQLKCVVQTLPEEPRKLIPVINLEPEDFKIEYKIAIGAALLVLLIPTIVAVSKIGVLGILLFSLALLLFYLSMRDFSILSNLNTFISGLKLINFNLDEEQAKLAQKYDLIMFLEKEEVQKANLVFTKQNRKVKIIYLIVFIIALISAYFVSTSANEIFRYTPIFIGTLKFPVFYPMIAVLLMGMEYSYAKYYSNSQLARYIKNILKAGWSTSNRGQFFGMIAISLPEIKKLSRDYVPLICGLIITIMDYCLNFSYLRLIKLDLFQSFLFAGIFTISLIAIVFFWLVPNLHKLEKIEHFLAMQVKSVNISQKPGANGNKENIKNLSSDKNLSNNSFQNN